MSSLNNILNSSGAGNTIIMVSAQDLKDYTDNIIAQTRRIVEEQFKPNYFTVDDMMERFSVSRGTVYNWMNSGKIKGYKMDDSPKAHLYFDQAEVAEAVRKGLVGKYVHK